jgi:hypothetical protein
MTSRGINKTTPAYDLKRCSSISAFSSSRLAGRRDITARYKGRKGTRSARSRLPFATGRTLHAAGQISQTAAHRFMEKVDRCYESTLSSPLWPELIPFSRFARIAQGPRLTVPHLLRSFRLGRLTGESDDKTSIIRWSCCRALTLSSPRDTFVLSLTKDIASPFSLMSCAFCIHHLQSITRSVSSNKQTISISLQVLFVSSA